MDACDATELVGADSEHSPVAFLQKKCTGSVTVTVSLIICRYSRPFVPAGADVRTQGEGGIPRCIQEVRHLIWAGVLPPRG